MRKLIAVSLVVLLAACSSDRPDASENPGTKPKASTTTSTAAPVKRDFSAIDPIVSKFVRDNKLNGATLIVVNKDDGIVYEESWGEFYSDRLSLIASSSKMITAGVLLRLQDDGKLDIDAPVAEVVDWGGAHPKITPAQLLSNSSGLVGLMPNPTFPPYLCQYVFTGTLQDCAKTIFTTADDDADVIAPDTEFRYGGGQWQVAGAVAEIASGKSWAELIDEIYIKPCGVDSLAYNNHFAQLGGAAFSYPTAFNGDPTTLKPTENPNMEGGVYIAPPDYAKLLLMHLRGGRCGDEQVLSQDALDRMHADRVGEVYDNGPAYGMGWWVDHERNQVSDGGAYGTVPWLDLEDGYGAYLVIEATSALGSKLADELKDPVERAMKG